eukprot:jgi/Hompol1/1312/HPOL_004346-RA
MELLITKVFKSYELSNVNTKSILRSGIASIKENVEKLMHFVQNPRGGHTYIELLKRLMEDIETDVLVFKTQMRETYEVLLNEERILDTELKAAEDRFAMWDTQTDHSEAYITNGAVAAVGQQGSSNIPKHHETRHSSLLPEIIEFNVRSSITRSTVDAIVAHEKWYEGYIKLLDKKKAAIAKWKESKQNSAKQIEAWIETDKDEQMQKHMHAQRKLEINREEQRLALAKWKEAREQQRLESEWNAEQRRRKESEREQRRKAEKGNLKKIVSVFVQQREAEQDLRRKWDEALALSHHNTPRSWKQTQAQLLKRDREIIKQRLLKRAEKDQIIQADRHRIEQIKL